VCKNNNLENSIFLLALSSTLRQNSVAM